MKKSRVQLSLLFISLLSGLLVSWQWHSRLVMAQQENHKQPELISIIESLEKEVASQENTVSELRNQLENLQRQKKQEKTSTHELQKRIETLLPLVGLTPVTGPGVIVTLDDNTAGAQAAKKSSPASYRPEDFIIHDRNILYLVNTLKAAGAEAIAVNGQRLVTCSSIRCVGTVILVNSSRLAPPYEIQAIGNPEALEAAVQSSIDFTLLKNRGFPVKVTKSNNLTLPAYKGSLPAEHMRRI